MSTGTPSCGGKTVLIDNGRYDELGAACACEVHPDLPGKPFEWRPCPYNLCERPDHYHDTELAWAAGFFDGEGTVSQTTASRTRRRYLLLRIGHVDRRPLDRFAAVTGGHVRGPYKQKGGGGRWSDYYVWQLAGSRAERVIHKLRPYLSGAKLDQYDRVKERINEFSEPAKGRHDGEACAAA